MSYTSSTEIEFGLSPDKKGFAVIDEGGTALPMQVIKPLTAAQLATYTGRTGEIVEVTDLPGRPQYRWNGAAMIPAVRQGQITALRQIDAGRLFNTRPVAMWGSPLPSPYDAAAWLNIPAAVRDPIVARNKQAAWEAMTATQRKAITHPSLVSIPGGWFGFEHWCAYTPYPAGDSVFENPCVAASKDLRTWVVPSGVQNPIVPPPAVTGYNSDTCLYWDATNALMVLLYRTRNDTAGTNTLYVMTATSPTQWSAPVAIWTGLIASAQDMGSPSIWYNAATAKWEIVGHNIDGGATWPFWKITSPSLLSGWDAVPVALNLVHPVAGRRWWHSHFLWMTDGSIVGVVQDNTGVGGGSGFVYLARSRDGVNFEVSKLSGTATGRYRPTLAPSITPDADMVVFYSKSADSVIEGYLHHLADTPPLEAERRRLLDALSATAKGLSFTPLVDDFDRADASVLATSSGGQAWTQVSGVDQIGINTNSATNLTIGNCRVHADVAATIYSILLQVGNLASETQAIVRWVDASNLLRFSMAAVGPTLQEIVAGAPTNLLYIGDGALADGDLVRIDVLVDRVKIYINGQIYGDVATTRFNSATRCGLQMSGTANLPKVKAMAVMPL